MRSTSLGGQQLVRASIEVLSDAWRLLHDVAGRDSAGLHGVVPHQDGRTVAIRITYHKFPKEVWPVEEFVETQVTLPRGETVTMKLTERGSWIGGKRDGLWGREVRKLNPDGHQTSLISSAYEHEGFMDAADLFSRCVPS